MRISIRIFLLTAVLSLVCILHSEAGNANQYRVMSCNVRITGLEDDAPFPERRWENRRDLCVNTILKRKPDFFCMQEVIYDSYEYFKQKCKGYTSYGFAGPEMDPYTSGYHFIGKNVIFFRTDRFELMDAGCYWLSDTPLVGGSMSWGTTRARHCNWVRLRDKSTGKQIRVIDTHLDHKVDEARRKQIKMVLDECSQYNPEMPQVLCGDFNAGANSAPIQYIRTQDGWKEMFESANGPAEPGFSYHGFLGENYKPKKESRRIDFIFYRGNISVTASEFIKDHQGKMYPSDHYFLQADFTIK